MGLFSNPVEIHFAAGILNRLPEIILNKKCLLLSSPSLKRLGLVDRLMSLCANANFTEFSQISANPQLRDTIGIYEQIKFCEPELIIALGGGSVIDTAKAIALLLEAKWDESQFRAHLRGDVNLKLISPTSPIIAIPTTAGSGSEVTHWATIWDDQDKKKYSLDDISLYPQIALVDPLLCLSLPKVTTIICALDVLSHAMEAIWNKFNNPISDALATKSLALVINNLPRFFEISNPEEVELRTELSKASLLAGLASSATRTAIAHSISYPFTIKFGLPHGIACSFTLPEILKIAYKLSPARASLILEALDVGSVDQGSDKLYQLYRRLELASHLTKHVSDIEAIDNLSESFITPSRAGNFIENIDIMTARQIAKVAYINLVSVRTETSSRAFGAVW